ncbi:GNAT family N-acetyltransferase [Labedaea rhizosphaerae]|uniref:Acetyltransferase (GNAT) family protein n=1 Tax=Labedaea rhizosphaerae TaxID=598644 RepID=A0A4R6S8L5_LABRH|nr:GNAT family N-acetyltransferase [Labedaea rhizosphaerae]TDP96190.1 acetyltransferase (GNAT) family protein [Labedaea rhizosphaerae]
MIQAALRASIEGRSVRVGPFLVVFNERSDNPFRNYAIPDDGAEPTDAELAALVDAFRARERKPRFELVTPNPPVEAALERFGFTVDDRLVLMAIDENDLTAPDPVPGIELVVADTDETMWDALRIQYVAYAEGAELVQADVDGALRAGADGQVMVLATVDGKPAGAGQSTVPKLGMTEIAGVAVLPEFRRRHVASLIGAELTKRAFAAGLRPYLQCETENEGRLYGKLGYRNSGELVTASLTCS